ncbi:magnesium transporter, partial [bacterium]|nr:magnesium transporter [bacterium]
MSLVKKIKDKKVNFEFNKEFIRVVTTKIANNDALFITNTFKEMHPADAADIIENLGQNDRESLIKLNNFNIDPEVFIELNESIQSEIITYLSSDSIATILKNLESDDAIKILERVDKKDKNIILSLLPPKDRFALLESLSYPEDTAARIMQREFTAIPSNWSVGQTIDYLRENKNLPEEFLEIFIVDEEFKPIGTVPSSKVLTTSRETKMISIMSASQQFIPVDMDKEEVGNLFENYNLNSAAVIDKTNKLVGMITYDDVLTVLKEEAEEDVLRLAGVGDEAITDGVLTKTRRRFNWLLLNLFTAFLATWVISLYGATIEQMIVLAFLMPIVASMGGNAGMQTLAVTIRSLATNDLTKNNFTTNILKEFNIGILNGIIFAVISSFIVQMWFQDIKLSMIISISMVLTMIMAGLFGILVPITLKRMNIDPAISSSVFVTTITDVIGFISFLGVA